RCPNAANDPAQQDTMDSTLEASPRRHDDTSHNASNGSRCLNRSKGQAVIPRPRKYHRCKECKGDACKKVAHKEYQLQTQQAGALKNILESIGSLFQQAATGLRALLRTLGLRHMYEQQGTYG